MWRFLSDENGNNFKNYTKPVELKYLKTSYIKHTTVIILIDLVNFFGHMIIVVKTNQPMIVGDLPLHLYKIRILWLKVDLSHNLILATVKMSNSLTENSLTTFETWLTLSLWK